jgi:hypothetical protein
MVTALLLILLVGAPFAALGLHAWLARRTELQLRARLDQLGERLDQVQGRLELTEQDLALALSQTGVAQGLLLEKGIADADEVEDMRRRLVTDGSAPGDGEAVH